MSSRNEKEICLSIKEIYVKLLDEFILLSNTFNYRSALEISCLFEYLLKNEYIGIKDYNTGDNACVLEDIEILGANTFAGGVCRHKSSMLNDIYHKSGINSMVLVGCFLKNKLDKFEDIFKDNSIKKETGEVEYNGIRYYILNYYGSYFTYPCFHDEDYYEKELGFPNHAIVLAGNERKILTDPALYQYYYLEKNDKIAAKSRTGRYFFIWEPKHESLDFTFYSSSLQKVFDEIMKKESIPDDEIFNVSKDIEKYLDNSKTILEEFINDNHNSIDLIKEKCLYLRKTSRPLTYFLKN